MRVGMALGYSFTDTVGTQPVDITVEDLGDSIKWTVDFPGEAPYDAPTIEGNGQWAVGLVIALDGNGNGPAFQIHNNDGTTPDFPYGDWLYSPWGPTIGDGWMGWHSGYDNTEVSTLGWVSATGERYNEVNPDGIFTITIDKSELGEEFHWALNLAIGTGFFGTYMVGEQMSVPIGVTPWFNWGTPIVDMTVPNYEYVPPPPPGDMSSFVIDHAKIDFKAKPNDDKVSVKGKLEIGNGVAISEDVIVTVGPFSETISMEEKGKEGEKWEYKRPKGGTGKIKQMTIDWKKGTFDFSMDKVDLSLMTDPDEVTISIQIGDDVGEATITMTETKHWDYKDGKKAETTESTQASEAGESIVQRESGLYQNYPNPFNPKTTIEYSLTESCDVTLKIYNMAGKLIRTLVDEYQSAGSYSIIWHGDNEVGEEIASGVYFFQIQAGDLVSTKKMVVLK